MQVGVHKQRPAHALPVLAAALFATACAGVRVAERGEVGPVAAPAPRFETVEIGNPTLAARVRALEQRSPTWRAGMDTLRMTGFQVLITDPQDVRRRIPGLEGYRARHLGEVLPVRDQDGNLIGAVVTVDVVLLEEIADRAGLTRLQLQADVERILVHEVYGHVVPLSWTRELVGGCPDPAPGEPASASCAILRENRIRQELGMEPRLAYDLRGLAVGRYLEDARGTRVARAGDK